LTIDSPIGAKQTAFTFVPELTGRFAAACKRAGQPSGAPLGWAKRGVLTVVP
jgi:hypothetical protein